MRPWSFLRGWLGSKTRPIRKKPSLSLQCLEDRIAPAAGLLGAAPGTGEVLLIDARVQEVEALQAGVRPGVAVHVLDGTRDGVDQVAEILAGYHDLSAVHIISHGRPGALSLGTTRLDRAALELHEDALSRWGNALSETGDLLLYGCEIGAGDEGQAFLQKLATISGADVAGSVDVTGAAGLGGDWVLENSIGTIETTSVVDAGASQSYAHLLVDQFTDLGSLGLSGVFAASVAWGDYDNDGDLDILLSGNLGGTNRITRVYRNDSGTFLDISSASLVGVDVGSVSWGDYDNDGNLDILLTGRDGGNVPLARVYRNAGSGAFVDISANLTGVRYSSAAWGDFDNDGDLDILLTGRSGALNASNITKIYRNDGGNLFTDISASLPGLSFGSVAWGDYDDDGDLDFLLTGTSTSGARITGVYRNDGNAGFTDISASLLPLNNSSVAWGDYDNDGDLDILLTGQDGGGTPRTKVYRNDGTAGFSDLSASLVGVFYGAAAWGDFDNDGDLDILLTGRTSDSARIARIYRNDGSGGFSDISASLTGVDLGSVAWGDFDNDGDLDILTAGRDPGSAFIARIYRNDELVANTQPSAPTGLTVTVLSPTSVQLTWTAPTDTQTPAAGLSYNLRVGTTPGGSDVVAPMALSSGRRTIAQFGSIETTTWTLTDLTPGQRYHWSVQAIDSALAGSAFATEATFTAPQFTDMGNLGLSNVAYSSVAWGDYDNDGDLDVLLAGKGGGRVAKVYQNTGGTFTDINANLTEVYRGSVAWGDYDNDGDLDILLTGISSGGRIAKVYRNDCGTFVDISANLIPVRSTGGNSAAWGDYDNDGDLDILLSGTDASNNPIARVFQNTSGTFTDISANLVDAYNGSVAWGDYDNDGDLDILLTGTDASNNSIARVYQNTSGTFTDISANLTGVRLASGVWGDYDNDGDLDILLSGLTSGNVRTAMLYQNTAGTFSEVSTSLTGVDFSSVAWGDYDNDGDLDILLTGRDGGNNKHSKVYRNDGSTFTDIGAGLPGVYDGSVAWGDYDNDGDLDILLTGDAGGFNRITRVLRNNSVTANTAPDAPTGLTVTVLSSNSVELSWTGPADGQTPPNGLSYNLRVGTTSGGKDVLSPMSLNSGTRTIVQRGLVQTTTWTLTDLTPDTQYFWSVQAIDSALAGSAFASESSFTTPPFTDLGSLGITGVLYGSVAWGDYDDDGDLDILLTGRDASNVPIARVYQNTNGTFTDISANLTGASTGSAAWGDYDNDGDLDILLTGRDAASNPIALVYQNTSGTFTDISAGLTGVYRGSVSWGDYDNDGDLDILLTGRDAASNRSARVYQNTSGSFTDISANLTGVSSSAATWGDYDNDGDLDILLTGLSDSSLIAQVYQNTSGTFSDISANLTGVYRSSVAWGDYDNDGDLDILLSGKDASTNLIARVYQNTSGSFTAISANLAGVEFGSVAWGDYDNDGDLDILLTGQDASTNRIARVYQNTSGSFTDISAGLTGVFIGSVAWGDYDNDGDLDILLTGDAGGFNRITRIYRNNELVANTQPSAPTGLTVTVLSPTSVQLTWTAPTDGQTPPDGLSYNLRVGTTSGGSDIVGPMSFLNNGLRKIVHRGLVQTITWTLTDLTPGQQYFWSVQAIDSAFAGSPFATESNFQTNAAPVLGGAQANQAVDDDVTIQPFSTFTISDTDIPAQTLTVTVQLSNAANGAFSASSLTASGFTDQGGGLYRFTGTAANAQVAIRQLVFDPTENQVAPGSTVTTTFTVSASDGIAAPVSDAATTVAASSVADAPTLTVANPVVTVDEGSQAVNSGTFGSPDVGAIVTVTASVGTIAQNNAAGTWSWTFTPSDETATQTVTITATDNLGAITSVQFALNVRNVLSFLTTTFGGMLHTDNDGDGQVDAGDALTYGIVVTNTGPDVATNVTVTPLLAPNVQRIGGTGKLFPDAALPAFQGFDQVFGRVGVWRNGTWYLDTNGSGGYDGGDVSTAFGGDPADRPVVGDWNGDGIDDIGVFRNGTWYLDANGSGSYDAGDATALFGQAGDVPVVGDWNGDGSDDLGVWRNGTWYLDTNPDRLYGAGDMTATYGLNSDRPVVGDWDGDGSDDLGVFRNGLWYLDANHSFAYDAGDASAQFGQGANPVTGAAGDVPAPGDWNGDGKDEVGVWRQGTWYHDSNASGTYDAGDASSTFGAAGDVPVVGKWSGGPQPLGIIAVGDLQPGQSARVEFRARVAPSTPAGTLSTNQALVNGTDSGTGLPYGTSISQLTQVVGQAPTVPAGPAVLLAGKTAPLATAAGTELAKIFFANAGGTTSAPAAVTIQLPPGVNLDLPGSAPGWTQIASGTFRLAVGPLAPQQIGYADVLLTFDPLNPPLLPVNLVAALA